MTTTLKQILTTHSVNDIKGLYHALQGTPLDCLQGSFAKEALNIRVSMSLSMANPDYHHYQRFNIALERLSLSSYQFSKKYNLNSSFTKRLTFVGKLNPRLTTLSPWVSSNTTFSILLYVFFPLMHNRLLLSV
jgi:hypothetical protein